MGAARRSVLGLAQRRAEILVDVGQGGGALVQGEIAYGRQVPGVVRQGPTGGGAGAGAAASDCSWLDEMASSATLVSADSDAYRIMKALNP